MNPYEADVQLFLAIVQAFVDALPPCPKRKLHADQIYQSETKNQDRSKRRNVITLLRNGVTELSRDLIKDCVTCDLPDGTFHKASEALGDLLATLDELVDDSILKESSADMAPRLSKLRALEALLKHNCPRHTANALDLFPDQISAWINYPEESTEPLRCRKIAKTIQEFNQTMNDINIATLHLESAQVEATQVFYRPRQSQEDTSYTNRAMADLQQALRLGELAKDLANVFAKIPKLCKPDHSVHIHLSGFEKNEIDMLVSVCGERQSEKWHIVHWASIGSLKSPDMQHNDMDSFCSLLQTSCKHKLRLRMQRQRDGCWHSPNSGRFDRIAKVIVPESSLSDWLCPRKEGESTPMQPTEMTREEKLRLALKIARSLLCLLGSPLIQIPWKSQSILVAEIADKSSDGLNIKPYILGKLRGCLCEEDSKQFAEAQSAIIHLGLLFWEIFIGEKITITEEDIEQDEDEDENEAEMQSLFNALNRKEALLRETSFIERSCLDLIANCLILYSQASVIDAAFRTKLYRSIVEPLITSFEDVSFSNRAPETAVKNEFAPDEYSHQLTKSQSQSQNANTLPDYTDVLHDGLGIEKPGRSTSPDRSNFAHKRKETVMRLKKRVLFDENVQTYQKRTHRDPNTEDFVSRMLTFVKSNILPLPNDSKDDITLDSDPLKRNIRIAVIDTGFYADDGDELVKGGEERIILKRNFFSTDEHAYIDTYGHRTHVVRLLLRFAPCAKIIVAKISNSKYEVAENRQIIEALTWVSSDECKADIIVLSFGLDQNPVIQSSIERLVEAGKIIFAAASNGGGNESRAFPANLDGVFCIHVSDGKGNKVGINPAPVSDDNFSTLGNAIDSKWNGEEVYISGSSFAAPVAAAIAANALEFIRHNLAGKNDRPKDFYTPRGMKKLFRCLSDRIDGYDYVKPWKKYLWDIETHPKDTCSALRALTIHRAVWWIKRTSEASFQGFG